MDEREDSRRLSFYLTALRELGESLARNARNVERPLPLRESLYRILGTLTIGRGALLLWDDEQRALTLAASKGLRPARLEPAELSWYEWKKVAATARPFQAHMAYGGAEVLAQRLRAACDRYRLAWLAPLSTGRALVGLLMLGEPIHGKPLTPQQLEILTEMSRLLALRIEELRARRRLADQVKQLQQLNQQLRAIYLETVRALAGAIDGPEEHGGPSHSLRVAALAAEMARRLKLNTERRERIYLAGLLHDIGKQIIEREVLETQRPLDETERRQVEQHPVAGCELISHLRFPWGDVAEIIRHHHERLDGRGYPDRLSGDAISLEARILMMAEAFDAMSSNQPWRPRLEFPRIIEQIHENLGLQFDARVAQALCDAVEAGLTGKARDDDFVPHLEASFDPGLIRTLLAELRQRIARPERDSARIIEMESTGSEATGDGPDS